MFRIGRRRTSFARVSDQPELADGVYEAFIVDAEELPNGGMHLDVVITIGEHKGFVVSVATNEPFGDQFELMGVPATLTVSGGQPMVRPEI